MIVPDAHGDWLNQRDDSYAKFMRDVGVNRVAEKKLLGDVDFEAVEKKASFITPVPGGVGLMTIAMLMKNTVRAAAQQTI